MASMIASTFDLSRPSEKFGTHSTSVDMTDEDSRGRGTEARQERRAQIYVSTMKLLMVQEFTDSQPDLHGVDAGIQISQACVRDVHVTHFKAHVVSRAQQMHAQRSLIHEVDAICVGGNVVVGKQHSAGEFQVRGDIAVTDEIPLQAERIESDAVGGIRGLKDEEYGNGVEGVLEAAAQNAREVGPSKDPSVAQPGVECAGVFGAARDGVAAAHPDLDFI